MKLAKPLVLLFIILYTCTTAGAQTQHKILDSFANEYANKIRNINEEAVLVHTDRKAYAAGEKIWFSAYVSKITDSRLDTASKSLFVDLVNGQDKPVAQLVLNTVNLNTQGAIALNDSLPAGLYWLRGYTMKMVKEDTNNIYIQPLYVYNFSKPSNNQSNGNTPSVGLQTSSAFVHFFPERVTRIQSIYTTGALQVTDANGRPIITSGNIINNHDSVVANFSTNRYGFARVNFYNNKVQQFQALVHLQTGDVKYTLPSINPFNTQVSLTGVSDSIVQAIVTLEDSVYSPSRTTFVLGLSHGRVLFSASGKGMYKISVPLGSFPGGTASLVLLDSAQNVLCERDFFIHKNNYNLTIQPDKDSYAKRDAVQLGVQLNDAAGKPLRAALNVAVQDGGLEEISDALETDSAGPTNNATDEWFLRNQAKLSAADIDLFMLARQPHYSRWLGGFVGKQYNDDIEKLQNLAGTVTDKKGRPAKEIVVTELTENKYDYNVYGQDTTGIQGQFKLPLPPNADSMALKLSLADKDGHSRLNNQIALDSFVYPVLTTPAGLKSKFFISDISIQKRLDVFDGSVVFSGVGKNWLKPVFVQTKAKADPFASTRITPGSHIIPPELLNQGGANTMASALITTVPGVSYVGRMVTVHGNIMGEPMVVVDGVPIITPGFAGKTSAYDDPDEPSAVLSFLKRSNPLDIDYIEVLVNQADAAMYGVRGMNGVIYVHTKAGSGKYVEPNNDMVIIHPVTYHTSPKFVMPDYSIPSIKNNKIPDPRTTIFWNGKLLTDQDGKAQVQFFTADDNSVYTVTVTGVTQNGDYIYKRITINRN